MLLAYTTDCIWRNRDQFIRGQEEIKAFLTMKYAKEQGYRLKKELFAFQDNKIVSCQIFRLMLENTCWYLILPTGIPGCPVLLRVP